MSKPIRRRLLRDAKQITHASHPALRSPNAEQELVPSAGDAERPMRAARFHMGRNHLAHASGDAINTVLAAAGY